MKCIIGCNLNVTYEIIILENLRFFILPINDDESVHICPHLADINKNISDSTDLPYLKLILDEFVDWLIMENNNIFDDKKSKEFSINVLHSINNVMPEPTLEVDNPPYMWGGPIIEVLINEYTDKADYESAFTCELIYRRIFGKSSLYSDYIIKELTNQKNQSINDKYIQLIYDKIIEELAKETGLSTDYIIEQFNKYKIKKNNEFIQSNYNDGIHQSIEILVNAFQSEYFGLSYDDNGYNKFAVDALVKILFEKIHLKQLELVGIVKELEPDGIVKELELDDIVKKLNELEGQIKTDKVDELTNRVEYLLKDFIRKNYISSKNLQSDYPEIYERALQLLEKDVKGIGEIYSDIFSKMYFGDCITIVHKNRFNINAQYNSWKGINWITVNNLHIVREFRNDLAHSDKKKDLDKSNEYIHRLEILTVSISLIQFFDRINLK